MRPPESVPVPRGWTSEAAWMGVGASLLLHLFAGTAMLVLISSSPKAAPQVVDVTLLAAAETSRGTARPVPHTAESATVSGRSAHPYPPDVASSPAITNPADVTTPAYPSDPAAIRSASVVGSSYSPPAVSPISGLGPATTTSGTQAGTSGSESPAGNLTGIRDAIQRAIAYPATARKKGWEGEVVVAFRLFPDGSVNDVRVVRGSGYVALDREAIDAVRNASPFPRSPCEAEVTTPVVYRLMNR